MSEFTLHLLTQPGPGLHHEIASTHPPSSKPQWVDVSEEVGRNKCIDGLYIRHAGENRVCKEKREIFPILSL